MDQDSLRQHLVGKVLSNPVSKKNYKITSLLYEGSMAYIYNAFDETLQTEVVIKALKYEEGGDERQIRERIQKKRKNSQWEYFLLVTIHDELSSAVPQVIDYLKPSSHHPWIQSQGKKEWMDGEPYLIMEKLSGKNLKEIHLPLSWEDSLNIAHSLSLFLDLIHRKGYVHQSLTPENIILGEDGLNVSIIDFDSVVKMGETSTEYLKELSPEKRSFLPEEEKFDTRCDIYSLGALLYYLLTGHHPAKKGIDLALPEFLSLPVKVQQVVQKSLAPLFSRYNTASEVARKIEEILGIRKIPIHTYIESPKVFPIQPGTTLKGGVYKIIKGLSAGGQGRIYVAENSQLKNRVLIKTPYYHASLLGSVSPEERSIVVKETHELLKVEKEMLGRFHSTTSMVPQPLDFFYDKSYENALEVYLPGMTRQVPYLVIEYIQGNTLDMVEKLTSREAMQIGDRLCNVIGCFHQHDYIYQDLKLANIIIDERGRNIYLIDLGSLCGLDPKTGNPREDMITYGTYTPGYRAPEWVQGTEHCGKRSDIYTIGATLWALISGESPGSYFQQWAEILSSRKRKGSIGEITYDSGMMEAESPHLPIDKMTLSSEEEKAGVRKLIEKTLDRDPQKRYFSVEELRKDIQRVLVTLQKR